MERLHRVYVPPRWSLMILAFQGTIPTWTLGKAHQLIIWVGQIGLSSNGAIKGAAYMDNKALALGCVVGAFARKNLSSLLELLSKPPVASALIDNLKTLAAEIERSRYRKWLVLREQPRRGDGGPIQDASKRNGDIIGRGGCKQKRGPTRSRSRVETKGRRQGDLGRTRRPRWTSSRQVCRGCTPVNSKI